MLFMTLVKDAKADIIWGDYYSGVVQQRRARINSEYNEDKWKFICRSRRDQGVRARRFLLDWLNLLKAGQGDKI